MSKNNFGNKPNKYSGKGRSKGKENGGRKGQDPHVGEDERIKGDKFSHVTDPMNAPDMYFDMNSDLTKGLFSFSFNQFQGIPFNVGRNRANKPYEADIATLMRIELNPSAGYMLSGTEPTSGINMQGLRNFIMLSSNNAKTTQYAPQDVTTLILALGEVISIISWCTRTFGLYQAYNIRNRMLPRDLLICNKIDADDFIQNIAQYRNDFNYLVTVANKIPFFDGIPYLSKCAKLYNGYYQDSPDSSMAQYFMFVPYSTWKFDEAYSSAGTGLKTEKRIIESVGGTGVKFSVVLDVLKDQLDALLNSATLNYVYSDVLRICDQKGFRRIGFNQVPDGYRVDPSYEPEAIHWYHNMRLCGTPLATADQHAITGYSFTPDNDVVPNANKNCVEYRPQFVCYSGVGNEETILDFPTQSPDMGMLIEATRLATLKRTEYVTNQGYYSYDIILADHYGCRILVKAGNDNWHGTADIAFDYADIRTASVTSSKNTLKLMDWLTKFDHGPLFFLTDESDPDDVLLSIYGDVNYYTTLNFDALKRIDDASFVHLMSF